MSKRISRSCQIAVPVSIWTAPPEVLPNDISLQLRSTFGLCCGCKGLTPAACSPSASSSSLRAGGVRSIDLMELAK